MDSQAHVAMATPARYLGQLCKHFAHKIPVTQEADRGTITFPAGFCSLEATQDTLVLRVTGADEEAVAKLEDVVARHLLRFAFREPPVVNWVRGGGQ
ncbi:DUF2218 domain-containing protein [Humitalea sp. 24SJ18S-53]|uniref:DUF2218 domain-containing protein n=1 Tax=Humitalea sp. 24SJ18S-53 TaxID=3422307 RepID=UPI003D66D3F5